MEKLYHYYYNGYHGNNLTSLFDTKAISLFNIFKHRVCTVSFKYQVFQKFVLIELYKRDEAYKVRPPVLLLPQSVLQKERMYQI